MKKIWAGEQRKQEKAKQRIEEDAKKREENLEKAKLVKITEDSSLPPAKTVRVEPSLHVFSMQAGPLLAPLHEIYDCHLFDICDQFPARLKFNATTFRTN